METIQGGLSVDDRGSLMFYNDFNFVERNIKRTYLVRNHGKFFVRAWHGHEHETKYVTVLAGTAMVRTVLIQDVNVLQRDIDLLEEQVDDERMDEEDALAAFNTRFEKLNITKTILTYEHPMILKIPAGNFNGFMNVTEGTILQFFSDKTLEESKGDDIRMDWDYLGADLWSIEYR